MRLIDADTLKKNCKITGEFSDNFNCVSLDTLGRVIDKQPTIQHECNCNKWHVVADGDLPENRKDILLCLFNGHISTGCRSNKSFYVDCMCDSRRFVAFDMVVAWMPLPEPCKEGVKDERD